MSAFGIDTTTPTGEKLGNFFKSQGGLTVPASDEITKMITGVLSARPFVLAPGSTEKTMMGYAAVPGTPAPASSLAFILNAVTKNPKATVFVDKTIVIPDAVAKGVFITSDPVQVKKFVNESTYFYFGGAKPSTGLLSASVFGIPVWLLAAAGGFGLITMARKKRY